MKRLIAAVALVALATPTALARSEVLDFDVSAALASSHNAAMLTDVPVFMKGQPHPEVARVVGTWKSNRPSRSALTSDENACQRAFMSAIITLQQRAKLEGGDAVIDIYSVGRGTDLTSATQFRCVTGNIVASVGLSGTVVSLRK